MLFETERLLVRRLREDDAEALHGLLSDPEVMRYIEPTFTPERTRTFLREAGLCEPPLVYAVTRKQTGELIGQLIWHGWDDDAMELGWILRRELWGRGLAKELTGALLAREKRDVVLECSPDQTATRHLAEIFGFLQVPSQDGRPVFRRRGLWTSVERMTREITAILGKKAHSLWLYGSVVLDDFRLGWSDVDFLALTSGPLTAEEAERLLLLRQRLSAQEPGNPYYRCFEGIVADRDEYLRQDYTRVVYWGTSGQRVTDRVGEDVFARYELAKYGRPVFGNPDRSLFREPDRGSLVRAVRDHLRGIRSCAVRTDESLYSCGWLLDVARCMYTLRFGDVIGKSKAGQWALEEGLFPAEDDLRQTLAIRNDPQAYKNRPAVKTWLRGLGDTVQRCADVLEDELRRMPPQP